jgi:hypothetical protein
MSDNKLKYNNSFLFSLLNFFLHKNYYKMLLYQKKVTFNENISKNTYNINYCKNDVWWNKSDYLYFQINFLRYKKLGI